MTDLNTHLIADFPESSSWHILILRDLEGAGTRETTVLQGFKDELFHFFVAVRCHFCSIVHDQDSLEVNLYQFLLVFAS